MRSRSVLVSAIALLLAAFSIHAADDPGQEVFVRTLDGYVTAVNQKDGDKAANSVTKECIDYYETGRKRALNRTAIDYEALDQMEVFMIFQLRLLRSKAELEKDDGKQVFEWGVREGIVNAKAFEPLAISKVQVEGDKAFATLTRDGNPVTDFVLQFSREDGDWKLDFMPVFKAMEAAFASIRERAGKTKVELAVYLLERQYKREIPPQILEGPLQ